MKKLLLIIVICASHYSCAMNDERFLCLFEDKQLEIIEQKAAVTSLHKACIKGDSEQVKKKLASPHCKVNKRGRIEVDGETMIGTPLFFACKYGHTDIVTLLLGAPGIKIDKCDYYFDYGTPLHVVKKAKIACLLCERGANMNAITQKLHRTPLIVHTLTKNRRMVELLVDGNVNVHHADCHNKNALVYALSSSDHPSPSIIKQLLKAGADLLQAAIRIIESRKVKEIDRMECACRDLVGHKFHFYMFPQWSIMHSERCPITLLQDNAAVLKCLYAPLQHKKYELKSPHAKQFRKALVTIKKLFDCCCDSENCDYENTVVGKHSAVWLHDRLFLYRASKEDLCLLFGEKSIVYAEELVALYNVPKKFETIRVQSVEHIVDALLDSEVNEISNKLLNEHQSRDGLASSYTSTEDVLLSSS